jgi:hypothetical protein
MRFREIRGGIQVPVSNEEQELLERIEKSSSTLRKDLNERERELARLMVSRGVLNRVRDSEQQVRYLINDLEDLWRN